MLSFIYLFKTKIQQNISFIFIYLVSYFELGYLRNEWDFHFDLNDFSCCLSVCLIMKYDIYC